jgi:hypothetical protein
VARFLTGCVVAGVGGSAWGAGPAGAAPDQTDFVTYTAAAAAPVLQITEDEPTSQFHPEGEGDYGYTLVTADPGADTALAAVAWPGSTVGNAGTLAEVLGAPSSASALNDPVQASASSGTSQTEKSLTAPSGTTMTASVKPSAAGGQHATATTELAGGGLGAAGSAGSSSSTSTIDYNPGSATLTVSATCSGTGIDIDNLVRIGSFTSSATATSVDGASPALQGATTFGTMTIAGQSAYLDGSGVHLGSPKAPAGAAVVQTVDTALAASGMEVYFTAPHTITVGGTAYYYAASVLFYWVPPGDPSHNSLTETLGGSGVSMASSASAFNLPPSTTPGAVTTGGSPSATSPTPATVSTGSDGSTPIPTGSGVLPSLAGTSGGASTTGGGTTLSLPAAPSTALETTGRQAALPAAVRLPGGVGAWWIALALAAALLGAGLTTRVPGLLDRRAASVCPREVRPTAKNPKEGR